MKLHLGCGRRFIPGFVHVDLERAEVLADVRRLPFNDGVAELIYASHVLEHFGRNEYREVLKEWFRVLTPGGVLRLAVPDFSACAALYYEGGLSSLSGLTGLLVGGQRDEHDFHKMVFDEITLSRDLRATGFRKVKRWDWRRTEHSEIDDYSQAYIPHMEKEHGRLMSLNLEGIK